MEDIWDIFDEKLGTLVDQSNKARIFNLILSSRVQASLSNKKDEKLIKIFIGFIIWSPFVCA